MVVSVDTDGSYNITFSETEQILFDKVCVATARPPEKVLGNLLFGALVVESLEIDAVDETPASEAIGPDGPVPYNPADRD